MDSTHENDPNPISSSAEMSIATTEIPSASNSSSPHGNGNGNESESASEPDSKRQKVSCDSGSKTIVEFFRNEENPLENDVILRNLLKVCGNKDLFNFRLLSRQWNSIATHVLKNSKFAVLKFVYNPTEKAFIKHSEPLSKLNSILSSSQDFPLVSYQFERGDLGSSEAQELFKNHGGKIKRLVLNLNNNNNADQSPPLPHTEIQTLRKILLEHATEMEGLVLQSIPIEWQQDSSLELFPEPRNTIQLTQLRGFAVKPEMFTTPKSYRLVQDILQAAVNLQRVVGYKIEFLDPHASAFENKIHVVKQINFSPREDNLDLYLKFAEGAPKLVKLGISDTLPISIENVNANGTNNAKKIAQVLQLILESSKDTLEQISRFFPLSFLPTLKFPRMSKFKTLCITHTRRDSTAVKFQLTLVLDLHRWIHHPLPVAQIFPSLVRVAIFSPVSLRPERHFLDYSQPLLSVKELIIFGNFSLVEKLAALFPAVEALRILTGLIQFQRMMPIIWKGFSNLKKLEVQSLTLDGNDINTENMDSSICGFSPETCVQLKNNSRNVKFEDVEALRSNPSICDATKLSTFNIQLRSSSTRAITRPLFSIVTGMFGFDMMRKKGGKVNIKATELPEQCRKIALSEIVHYIDSE